MQTKFYSALISIFFILSVNTAFAIPPTTQTYNLYFNSVDGGSLRLNWSNGNGARRIVIAREAVAVTASPVNGTDYLADDDFNQGQQVAAGQYVVFDGSGTYADIKNLQPATVYHFSVYEYNGTASSTEYIAVGSVASAATLSAPTAQATNLTFTNVTGNSMKINWQAGNGTRRIVLLRKDEPVNANPADLVNYSSSSTFTIGDEIGSGNYVVHNGTGNSVTVTALSPSSTYHVAVFEANGTATPVFLTVNPLTGSRQTLPRPTEEASGVGFTQINGNSFRLAWTNGNGSKRIIIMRAGADVNVLPVDGTDYLAPVSSPFNTAPEISGGNKVIYDNTGNSLDVTGLVPNTTYYVKIFEYDGSGTSIAYQVDSFGFGQQATLSAPTSQAINVTFTNITGNSITVNWINGNGSKRIVLAKSGAPVDAVPVDLVNHSAQAAFMSGAQLGTGNYVVYNGSSNTVTVTGLSTSLTYHFAVFEANGSSAPVYNTISPAVNSATTSDRPTLPASSITNSMVEGNSMRISWTNGNGTRRIVVARMNAAVDAIPQDGVDYLAATSSPFNSAPEITEGQKVIYDNTGNFTDLTGLTTGNVYHFRVYEYSGTGSGITYLQSSPPFNNFPTLVAPTQAAVAQPATNIAGNSMTLNWTNGNGAKRVVFLKEGAPVDVIPADYSLYSGTNNFSTATTVGNGNKIVYNGNLNNVTVSNLSLNTTYHYAIFEYNGTLGPVYIQTAATGTVTTFATPTTPSGNLSFTSIDGNQMKLNWTGGNGLRRIIIAREGAAVDAVPVNSTDYLLANSSPFNTAPEITPGQKVVYDNNGESYEIKGLNPNKTYHFRIYEYSGTGASITYLTSLYAFNSQATLSAPTIQATTLSFTSVASNSMIVGWTNGDGARRLLVAKKGSPVDVTPADLTLYAPSTAFMNGSQIGTGNYVLMASSASNLTVTNLQPGTTYHYAIFEYNGNEGPVYLKPGTTGMATTIGPPSTEASSAFASAISNNSAQLNWINGSGNRRLVLMKKDAPVDALPVNNASYFANSFFSSGTDIGSGNYVVFDGIQNFVTVTNLEVGHSYHFAVFEYNEFGTTSQFLLTNPARGTLTTVVLPVTMIHFKAKAEQGSVKLEWATSQELNSRSFEIERSNDGISFVLTGSKQAAGNSITRKDYLYIDQNAFNGNNYYRLKQIDLDGSHRYSNVVKVSVDKQQLISKFINPVQGKLTLVMASEPKATIAFIYDSDGRLMNKIAINQQRTDIDVSRLSTGIYVIEVVAGDKHESRRFIR